MTKKQKPVLKILKLKNLNLAIIIVISLLLFTADVSIAATYFVSPSGNDSSSGSISAPFRTIQRAANIVNPGDTVCVRAGIYNQRVKLTRSGTSGKYITFQNYSGETAIIDGTGLGEGVMFHGSEISWVKIIGFKVRNYTGGGIQITSRSNYNGSHIEIRDNEVFNQSAGHTTTLNAILVVAWPWGGTGSYSDVIIDNNYVHNVTTCRTSGGCNEALSVGATIRRFQITNNVIDNASYIGIDLIGRSSQYPADGIVSDNEVKNSGAASNHDAIYVDGAKNVTIESNKIHDNIGMGIAVSAEQKGFVTENIIVRRNLTWNNTRNIQVGSRDKGLADNLRVVHNTAFQGGSSYSNYALYAGSGTVLKNNISYIQGTSLYHVSHDTGTSYNYSFDYNCYYPNEGKYWKYKGTSYRLFLNLQAKGQDTHGTAQDPLFVNLANRDFRLQSGSPCINSGGFLTVTTSAGSGQTVAVQDARYFTDGYGVVPGDLIQVGSNSPVRATAVNYSTNTITVDRSISWNSGEGVSYPYSGSRPDIGAYEYTSDE